MLLSLPFVLLFVWLLPEDFIRHVDAPQSQTQNLNMLTLVLVKQPCLSLFFLFFFSSHVSYPFLDILLFLFSAFLALFLSICLSLLLLHNSVCVEQPESRCYSSETSFNWKLVLSHARKSLEWFIVPDLILLSILVNFLNSLWFCDLFSSVFRSPSIQLLSFFNVPFVLSQPLPSFTHDAFFHCLFLTLSFLRLFLC